MPLSPADVRDARVNTARMAKLLENVRQRGMLAPANLHGADGAPTPAQRSAAAMGVGDNLRAAITDVYTADQPAAASWVDHMMADMVNGNGSIDPSLAFAKVETKPLGSTRGRLMNPHQIMAETMGMIASGLGLAIQAHRGVAGG